jgi:hypothetical protein
MIVHLFNEVCNIIIEAWNFNIRNTFPNLLFYPKTYMVEFNLKLQIKYICVKIYILDLLKTLYWVWSQTNLNFTLLLSRPYFENIKLTTKSWVLFINCSLIFAPHILNIVGVELFSLSLSIYSHAKNQWTKTQSIIFKTAIQILLYVEFSIFKTRALLQNFNQFQHTMLFTTKLDFLFLSLLRHCRYLKNCIFS